MSTNDGADLTVSAQRHLIKKYANRKLYDTQTSRYITLEGIAELVRDGHEINVVDRDTGQDLTQVTLSQIVLSAEKRGPARLVGAGAEAIHDRGQPPLDSVPTPPTAPCTRCNRPDRHHSQPPVRGPADQSRRPPRGRDQGAKLGRGSQVALP